MSATAADRTDVIVVGAGPVGLLLACLLLRRGIACRVLEQRTAPAAHSRSVGIHPVALEILDELGIAERFISGGHRIERGRAYVNRRHVGTVSFSRCPAPFRFILTLPQYRTEALLEQCVHELDPKALVRGVKVQECRVREHRAMVAYGRDSAPSWMSAQLVAGCDGMHSIVRRSAGIAFIGAKYPDAYIMGDFTDTGARTDAEIYLHQDGLVESIPLPDNRRRWVVKTSAQLPEVSREDVVKRVRRRLGIDLAHRESFMLSAFGVQHYQAPCYFRGRVVLAGDAAHVISPIGGQGMNLGWLDACCLAQALADGVRQEALRGYDVKRRAAAEKARRRGEFNMNLGRSFSYPPLRRALVQTMLMPPFAGRMARIFTMRGL